MDNKSSEQLSGSDKRTRLLKRNVLATFLLKGWGGVVYLLLVAVTLRCIGAYENGIWLTISSLMVWIDMMDIGLGNGLRNSLAVNLANGDVEKARQAVSTTFFMLIIIVVPLTLGCLTLVENVDLYGLLNVDPIQVPNLSAVVCIAVTLVCINFVFKFVGNVYMALQLPAVSNALVVGGQTLGLLLTVVIYFSGIRSLMLVTVANTIAPLAIYVIAYFVTFGKLYPHLRPSIKCFRSSAFSMLLSLGIKFFVLQIAGMLIFASSNVLISHLFSPSEVTNYQVAYRYFSIINMLFTVVSMPFWSATTDAYARGDWDWIESAIKKILKVILLSSLIAAVMVAIAQPVYSLWVGDEVHIDFSTNVLMAVYVLLLIFSLAYSTLLNGMGKLKLQLIFTTAAAIAFIPLVLCLYKPFGLNGIIIALILVNTPGAVINAWQYNHIIKTER